MTDNLRIVAGETGSIQNASADARGSTIRTSKVPLREGQDPRGALSTVVDGAQHALWRFININLDEATSEKVVEPVYESLQGIRDIAQILSVSIGNNELMRGSAAVADEVRELDARVTEFLISFSTFCSIASKANASLGYLEWKDIRKDAFRLVRTLDILTSKVVATEAD